jgi:hypothetical protein
MIKRPADCEIRSVIRFLNARNVKPADILRQICEIYGENVMSDATVRKRGRKFNEGRDNVHDEPRRGRPTVKYGLISSVRVRSRGFPQMGGCCLLKFN